jgi:simple sugar transport system permease protein
VELVEKETEMTLEAADLVPLLESTLRGSTPLVLAALGGVFCERSGVIQLGLEGLMLMGAFVAAVAANAVYSPWLGAVAAILAGGGLAAVYALFVINLRSNQIVAGTAVNLFALGLTPFLCKILYGSAGGTPALALNARFQTAPIWAAWILTGIVTLWLRYTSSGLWVRFAGENPEALESAGIRVNRVRWAMIVLSGAFAGLGGASLSICLASSFSRNMTSGRGFMALAALIFGKWRPLPAALACLLFGCADALQIRLQGVVLWGTEPVPVQFIQILPYLVTILVLAGFVGQSRAPRALGLPFDRA